MPDAPSYPSRTKFSGDLRRIREERGLTLEALHEETKIPLSVLEEFEETGLFDNPMFNRVYLRSLVRTYASFVDIPTKTMLEALDAALLDTYEGSLARLYLNVTPTKAGSAPPVDAAPAVAAPSTAEAPTPEETAPDAPTAEEAAPEAPSADRKIGVVQEIEHMLRAGETTPNDEPASPIVDEAELPELPELPEVSETPEPSESPAEKTPRGRTRPPLLTTAEASWEAPLSRRSGRRVKPVDVKRRAWYTQWVIIVGAVLGFAAAIWAVIVLIDRPDDASFQQAASADIVAADTAGAAIEDEPLRPRLLLQDTLYVVLLATEKVERIQIRRDDDLLRSYWIEQDVAKAFPALERIVFENRLDLIRLFVEGFEYPTDLRDEEGRLIITRADLQRFADTLTAPPVQLPARPDTIPVWPVRAQ